MALYQRIPTAQIDAVQFTPKLADALREHVLKGEPRPGDAPAALTYEEHAGFKLDTARVAFGDYIVGGSSVVAREEFEAQYEPVRGEKPLEPAAPQTVLVKLDADTAVDVPLSELVDGYLQARAYSESRKLVESRMAED